MHPAARLTPWRRPRALLEMLALVHLGFVVGIVGFVVVVTLLSLGAGLLITFVLALPVIWALFACARGLGHVERSRIGALTGEPIPDPVPAPTSPSWLGRLRERAGSAARWKEIGYHLLALFPATIGFALTTAAWAGSIAMALLPLTVRAFPDRTAHLYLLDLHDGPGLALAAAVGIVGLVAVAPWVTVGAAKAQIGLARALLGPAAGEALAGRVRTLETSRAAAVDTAEAERRRIERDLHDGAQQRLVALAANLGSAREKLDSDPEAGRRLVGEAHQEAKAALREIRDLVRGIHPVILEDRGLDAALSAVVARCPVPVTLDVNVNRRPPPAVESAAYFVVSEALTNVARHSHAARAVVEVARVGDRLVLEVRDDGAGGADASAGSGLQGLRDRVTALGGSMHVISPQGGPTTISVELPCGS